MTEQEELEHLLEELRAERNLDAHHEVYLRIEKWLDGVSPKGLKQILKQLSWKDRNLMDDLLMQKEEYARYARKEWKEKHGHLPDWAKPDPPK